MTTVNHKGLLLELLFKKGSEKVHFYPQKKVK